MESVYGMCYGMCSGMCCGIWSGMEASVEGLCRTSGRRGAEEEVVAPEVGVGDGSDGTGGSQQVGDELLGFRPQLVEFGEDDVQLRVVASVQEGRQLRQTALQQLLVRFSRRFRPEQKRESFDEVDLLAQPVHQHRCVDLRYGRHGRRRFRHRQALVEVHHGESGLLHIVQHQDRIAT